MKSRDLNFLGPSGPLQACNGTDLHFFPHQICFYYYETLLIVSVLISPAANLGYVVIHNSEVQVLKWLLILRLKSYEEF